MHHCSSGRETCLMTCRTTSADYVYISLKMWQFRTYRILDKIGQCSHIVTLCLVGIAIAVAKM
jgi:hypothetical protein